jgi:hypothetical protein
MAPKMDSDDKWFNNPQIRFTITKSIKTMYISLVQPDTKISKLPYAPCSFYLFKAKVSKNRKMYRINSIVYGSR